MSRVLSFLSMQQPQTIGEVVRPHWYEYVTIAAIVLGPILALLAQRALDWLRKREETQKHLYFTLMSTRVVFQATEHVQALNSIDVVFSADAASGDSGARPDRWRAQARAPVDEFCYA